MKTNTVSLVLGFAFLSLASVACADSDESVETPSAETAPVTGKEAVAPIDPAVEVKQPSIAVPAPIDPAVEAKTPIPSSMDPIDPAIDNAIGWPSDPTQAEEPMPEQPAPPKIPVAKVGAVHAVSNIGDNCTFTIDGFSKGTGTVLDWKYVVGTHIVTCLRDDGSSAMASFTVVEGKTTDVVITFEDAHLSLVAINGICGFSVDGVDKGWAVSTKLDVLAGERTIVCSASNGGVLTQKVTLKPGESATSTFIVSK